jgi:hypothetical protein
MRGRGIGRAVELDLSNDRGDEDDVGDEVSGDVFS